MPKAKTALFICHDELQSVFDRRITQQALLLQDMGYDINIVSLAKESHIRSVSGINIFGAYIEENVKNDYFREFFAELSNVINGTNPFVVLHTTRKKIIKRQFLWSVWLHLPIRLQMLLRRLLRKYKTRILKRMYDYPEWVFWAAKLNWLIRNTAYDLYVACDLPAAVAVMTLKREEKRKWWFDAHELFMEQNWVVNQGFTSIGEELEKKAIQECNFFSTVNTRALDLLLEKGNRPLDENCFVFTNTLHHPEAHMSHKSPERSHVIKEGDVLRLVFHGGLSDSRGVHDFAEVLRLVTQLQWSLDLFGWSVGAKLEKLRLADNRIRIHPPFPADATYSFINDFDAVVLPYKVIDRNTLLSMPNKLGDALEIGLPVVYNKELTVVHEYNNRFQFGQPFCYSKEPTVAKESLTSALRALRGISYDKTIVRKQIGCEYNQKTLNQIFKKLV